MVVWNNDARAGISTWGVHDYIIEEDRRFNPAGIYYDAEGNLNYYEDQTDNYNQTHYQLILSQRLGRRLTANAALHYTRGFGYFEQYMDDANFFHTTAFAAYGFDDLYYLQNDTTRRYGSDLVRQRWLDNHFYGATWSLNYQAGKLRTILGGGINRYDGDHFGRILWAEFNPGIPKDHEYYLNNGLKDDMNVYAKADYAFTGNLRAFADLQYRRIDYDLSGLSDDLFSLNEEHVYHFFNPKLGLSYSKDHYRVYGSWAVANREPTRANLKDAAGDDDATPRPERLNNLELGYLYYSPRFSAGINGYYMLYKDQLVPTGEKSDVGYDIMTNVEDSYRLGMEIMTSWKPSADFRVDVNATLSENRIVQFTEYVDTQSEVIENSHIAYSPGVLVNSSLEWTPFERASVRLTGRYVGEQYYDNSSEEGALIDDYLLTDLSLSYSLDIPQMEEVDFRFKINNLLNRKIITNAYGGKYLEEGEEIRWSYYYPLAPINFMAQVRLRF
jgi:iron complex outermembrane receptor protein